MQIHTILSLVIFLFPATSIAADFLTTLGQGPTSATVSAGDRFLVNLDLNRSYVCTLTGSDPASELGLDANALNPLSVSVSTVLRGNTTPQVTSGIGSDLDFNDNRAAIFSTIAGVWAFSVSSAKAGGESARFECKESTLYASWNTTSAPFNFLELVNISSEPVTIIWIARDFTGVTFSDTITIPANRRADLDLHSTLGVPNFGDIKVKIDGPIGSIRGAISIYDENLELKVTNTLSRREN